MRRTVISQQQKKRPSVVSSIPTIVVTNNQPEEIAYFSAYVLPLAQKANIQTALNTYGTIRLEVGDYSGVDVTLSSNQKIYGAPSFQSKISNITI